MIIDKKKLSPMMTHYLTVKEKHPDALVFYRLGDFYEMFFDDAIKASSLLDLTLTGRDCGLEERAPMCGIPFHASELYISKLVALGEKVAICEQLTEPNKGELVKRDVVRIVTAGTVIESDLIDEKKNNFVACLSKIGDSFACAWADITTGEFFVKSYEFPSDLIDDLVKLSPAEIVSDEFFYEISKDLPFVKHNVLPKFSLFTAYSFEPENARETLKKHFSVLTLTPYGIEDDNASISASGALISYLTETQKHAIGNIVDLVKICESEFMDLDVTAVRNLELVKTLKDGKGYGTLLWLLDETKTSMGARKLQSLLLSPLKNIQKINDRLDAVDIFYKNALLRQGVSELLKSVKDIGRITGKVSNGNLLPKDCLALASSLEVLPSLKFHLTGLNSTLINSLCNEIVDFSEIFNLLNTAINPDAPPTLKDGGYIKEGFNAELDELRSISKNAQKLINEMEVRERDNTGIKTLRIRYNRVFGYYIEVTNSFKDLVPYNYHRRQTIANAERYITDELKDLESKILSADEKTLKIEQELFTNIKATLFSKISELNRASDAIAMIDVLNTLAVVAKKNNFVKPIILPSSENLKIVNGRHPVVEAISKDNFIPNDTLLNNSTDNMAIITGPNMAGKSTYMRQVALITILAHIGSFVPASSAEIPIIDKIFTRIGASDNLIFDQSTFMVEMTEVATILKRATKDSLIILDEIGRGTSTYDGLSIAWAVVEHIAEKLKAKTLFATHYHELTELEGKLDGVKNYKVTVKELNGSIVFLRKIMRGGANKSFGIEVAYLAGVDKSVTDKAKSILKKLERKEITLKNPSNEENIEQTTQSEVERIISDLDLNNLSPMQAFMILTDLKEKIDKNND